MYSEIIDYVRNYFENNNEKTSELSLEQPFRNRYLHIMRVFRWAMRINEVEKGDTDVVAVASLFHDIGKAHESERPHAIVGAEICDEYLKEKGFDKDFRLRVFNAIKNHSSKTNTSLLLRLEDKILMDADLLDEAGALAILWGSMSVALGNDPGYVKAYERHKQYYEELKQQYKKCKTDYGRKLFSERVKFLQDFINNLGYELGLEHIFDA